MRPSFDAWMLAIAQTAATRSTCKRAQVGAVIARDNRVLALGYGGSPAGAPHCLDVGCELGETGGCVRTRGHHAEQNAIRQAAEHGVGALTGATCVTTLSPCQVCAEALYAAGVTRVLYGVEYRLPDSIEWLRARGLTVERVTD